MRFFISTPVCSTKMKQALEKAINLRSKMSFTSQELAEANKELKIITDDQARIRANMKELPQTAEIYKTYLDKFTKQEKEIEKLQASIKKLQETELAQRRDYETYLANLDVE
jgi:septal ring factor EnvC (AmiA/AmiB activator)